MDYDAEGAEGGGESGMKMKRAEGDGVRNAHDTCSLIIQYRIHGICMAWRPAF